MTFLAKQVRLERPTAAALSSAVTRDGQRVQSGGAPRGSEVRAYAVATDRDRPRLGAAFTWLDSERRQALFPAVATMLERLHWAGHNSVQVRWLLRYLTTVASVEQLAAEAKMDAFDMQRALNAAAYRTCRYDFGRTFDRDVRIAVPAT